MLGLDGPAHEGQPLTGDRHLSPQSDDIGRNPRHVGHAGTVSQSSWRTRRRTPRTTPARSRARRRASAWKRSNKGPLSIGEVFAEEHVPVVLSRLQQLLVLKMVPALGQALCEF